MTTTTNTAKPLAVWYRRRSSTAQQSESSDRRDRERQQAEAVASRVGARIACEVDATGASSSRLVQAAWTSAKHEAATLGAKYIIVLSTGELARHLPDYYTKGEELSAEGLEPLHEAGTPDWNDKVSQLLTTFLQALQEADSRPHSERAREAWRKRKARLQAESEATELTNDAA